MPTYGFRRDVGNSELDIHVNGTVSLTFSSSKVTLPVSTITYGGRGTITQETNHGTGVTINATSGTITLASADLAAGAEETFTVTNSFVAVGDVVYVNVASNNDSSGTPQIGILSVDSGGFDIILSNPHATTAAFNDATTLNFVVIKTAA